MTLQKCGSKQIESPTFVQTFSWSTGVLIFHHRIVKFPNEYYRMEKILSEEEKHRINVLLEKHQPREEIKEKEMVVLSEKGREIGIKTKVASSSMKPFEEQLVEYEEEASKRKYEVFGTDTEIRIWRDGYWRRRMWSEKINQRRIRNVSSIQGILQNSGKN